MAIIDQVAWDGHVERNDDPYGGACVNVARRVMELLDELPEGANVDTHKLICDADKDIKAGGITGFMAGCVAQMVGQCHSRGDEFRKSWNKDNGIEEEQAKGGTVNPAILTIGE